MTSVLRELQAEYAHRALEAQEAFVSVSEPFTRPKATRTYTTETLERRRAWGRLWGGMNAEHARKLRAGELED